MAIETEVKIRLDEKGLAGIIKKLGKPEFFPQQNIFYQFPKGFLRIRGENGKTYITLKGKNNSKEYNEREEIEFRVQTQSLSELRHLFGSLGMIEKLHYEKQRANFRLNDCIVSIDLLPDGKTYIEIEGNREKITKNLRALDLIRYPRENRSYFEMLGGKIDASSR
ncbi:MAG: class IV adenylate cyclase [Candidatus Paceibacterota bacterium]